MRRRQFLRMRFDAPVSHEFFFLSCFFWRNLILKWKRRGKEENHGCHGKPVFSSFFLSFVCAFFFDGRQREIFRWFLVGFSRVILEEFHLTFFWLFLDFFYQFYLTFSSNFTWLSLSILLDFFYQFYLTFSSNFTWLFLSILLDFFIEILLDFFYQFYLTFSSNFTWLSLSILLDFFYQFYLTFSSNFTWLSPAILLDFF